MPPPSQFYSMISKSGASVTTAGDALTAIPGKRIIIDRISYEVDFPATDANTFGLRRVTQETSQFFWARYGRAETIDGDEVINLILRPGEIPTISASTGVDYYLSIFWRVCDV